MSNQQQLFTIPEFIAEAKSVMAKKEHPHEKQTVLKELLMALFTENKIDQLKDMLDQSAAKGGDLSDRIIHCDDELSVVYVHLPKHYQSGVFDHATHCVTLTLQGTEGNTFYKEKEDGSLEHIRELDVAFGQVLEFPPDCIRSVENKTNVETKVLQCFLGNLNQLNKKRHVYDWNKHTKEPYSFDAVVKHGVTRMKAHKNDVGLKTLYEAGYARSEIEKAQ